MVKGLSKPSPTPPSPPPLPLPVRYPMSRFSRAFESASCSPLHVRVSYGHSTFYNRSREKKEYKWEGGGGRGEGEGKKWIIHRFSQLKQHRRYARDRVSEYLPSITLWSSGEELYRRDCSMNCKWSASPWMANRINLISRYEVSAAWLPENKFRMTRVNRRGSVANCRLWVSGEEWSEETKRRFCIFEWEEKK